MKKYLPRIADDILDSKLKSCGAVLITGPKWCGKSTTALRHAKSSIFMQDVETKEQNILLAKISASTFLSGATPKLIDEWQVIPFIRDSIRYEVDKRDEFGQFILTGSATPADQSKIEHSGIGRIVRMQMRPMSLFESEDSIGSVSLKSLFEGIDSIGSVNDVSLTKLAYLICRGGWPKSVNLSEEISLEQAFNYVDGIIETDMSKVDGVKRSPERVKRLLKSLARHISTQANLSTIKKDMSNNDANTLDEGTIVSYIDALKKLYVVEDLPARNPNLRSKAAIRSQETREFIDPSIATAALGLGPQDLMNDLKYFGLLFESLCIRDLRVYAAKLNGKVYHYRDNNGLEVDAVIHLRNGDYGLVEIKLGDNDLINEGAKNLLKLSSIIDTTKMKKPSFLMVLTGTHAAYRREDGVYVVPLTCLKDWAVTFLNVLMVGKSINIKQFCAFNRERKKYELSLNWSIYRLI